MNRSPFARHVRPVAAAGLLAALLCFGTGSRAALAQARPAAAVSDSALMQRGMSLLRAGDPAAAADVFREVRTRTPTHYGARFQLARALDLAGEPAQARPVWEEVLGASEAIKDSTTSAAARLRLAQPDTVSQAAMMRKGSHLLYTKALPAAAAVEFRAVLERNPDHYGATFQLAKALDAAGKPAEARPYWQKILGMAEAIKDQPTADTARARLRGTR